MNDIRAVERESIRAFVRQAADDGYLNGRVLDYGCGKQPYRDIIEEVAEYDGYDMTGYPANISDEDIGEDLPWNSNVWDAILCTQVIQYVEDPDAFVRQLASYLYGSGILVMTGPSNWPIVQTEDLRRFTPEGIAVLLRRAGWEIVRLERRGVFAFGGDSRWCLGWGVIARV